MKQDQLPPTVGIEIQNGENLNGKKRGPFDDFPSMQHKTQKHRRFHADSTSSQSERVLPNALTHVCVFMILFWYFT